MKSYDDIIARVAIIINSGVSYRTLQMSSRESPYRASPCDRTITFNLTPPLHWSCSSRPLTLSLSLSLCLLFLFSSSSFPFPPPPPNSPPLRFPSHQKSFFFSFLFFQSLACWLPFFRGISYPRSFLESLAQKRSSSTGCFLSFLSLACAVYRSSSHLF